VFTRHSKLDEKAARLRAGRDRESRLRNARAQRRALAARSVFLSQELVLSAANKGNVSEGGRRGNGKGVTPGEEVQWAAGLLLAWAEEQPTVTWVGACVLARLLAGTGGWPEDLADAAS